MSSNKQPARRNLGAGWTIRFSRIMVTAAAGLWSIGASAAPITFNTALPVGKGEFVARGQAILFRSGDDPSGARRELAAGVFSSVLGYGATGRLAVFTALPYVDKELEVTESGNRRRRRASGFGDFSAFGRYTIYKRDVRGETFRLAPFAGLTAPTGEDSERDAIGTLPPSVQPGTGAWDLFAGLVATYQTLDYQIDGQIAYRMNGSANGFERGDLLRADASVQYRLWPRTLDHGVPGFLYGVLEAGISYRGKNRIGSGDDPDSGGRSLFVTPGVQYVTRRWIVEAGVELPLVQDLNGTALESDYVVHAGVRFNF